MYKNQLKSFYEQKAQFKATAQLLKVRICIYDCAAIAVLCILYFYDLSIAQRFDLCLCKEL